MSFSCDRSSAALPSGESPRSRATSSGEGGLVMSKTAKRRKEGEGFDADRLEGRSEIERAHLFPSTLHAVDPPFPQLWHALRTPFLILVYAISMNPTSPTSPPRLQRLNSATPPPRASTSSRGGRSTPSASSYRVLIPTLHPKEEDLPLELRNYGIIDEVELKGFKVFAVGSW